MIVVNAVIEATPETIDVIREAIATMEAASRAEPGCRDYAFSVELNNPAIMRVTEQWDSMDDLAAHFAMPHMADFLAALAVNPPQSADAKFYEAREVEVALPG